MDVSDEYLQRLRKRMGSSAEALVKIHRERLVEMIVEIERGRRGDAARELGRAADLAAIRRA